MKRPDYREHAMLLPFLDQYGLTELEIFKYSNAVLIWENIIPVNALLMQAAAEGISVGEKANKAITRGDVQARKKLASKLAARYFLPSRHKLDKTVGEASLPAQIKIFDTYTDIFKKQKGKEELKTKEDYAELLRFYTYEEMIHPLIVYGLCLVMDEEYVLQQKPLGFSLADIYWEVNESFFNAWKQVMEVAPGHIHLTLLGFSAKAKPQQIIQMKDTLGRLTEDNLYNAMKQNEIQHDRLIEERKMYADQVLELRIKLAEREKEIEQLRKQLAAEQLRVAEFEKKKKLSDKKIVVLGDPGRKEEYLEIVKDYGASSVEFADPISETHRSQRLSEWADIVFMITTYCKHKVSKSIPKEKVVYVNNAGLESLRHEVEMLSV